MVVMGIVLSLLLKYFVLEHQLEHPFTIYHFIILTIGTIIIWEGNLQIDMALNKHYSWVTNTQKRLLFQIGACFLYTILMLLNLLFWGHTLLDSPNVIHHKGIDPLFSIGSVFAFTVITIDIGNQFFHGWKQSLLEVERYKTESANANLQNLKNQLNPHFLFNNLSVLTSLIYINQDKAVAFINELSKVYRYTLDNKNAELVSLREELDFLYHYIYLLKIRFDSSISFNFSIDEKRINFYLPPMCLQMLVENTIQHNEASQAKPLNVLIYTNENYLIIQNLIQKRSDVNDSSGIGLKNIQLRYSYFTDDKIEISNDGTKFMVSLPLIKQK